jgi:hypothetical protein
MRTGKDNSTYLSKLASVDGTSFYVPERFTIPKTWEPHWFFFYDTLMQPSQLAEILELPETPRPRPASVRSYTLASLRESKATVLLDEGGISSVVSGMAYLLQSELEEKRLMDRGANACVRQSVMIWFMDNEEPSSAIGYAFVYNGDTAEVDRASS